MSQCKIYLENYSGVYYAGSEIRGRFECYFNEDTKIRGIKIRLKGQEHNEWTDTEEYLDTTDNKHKTRWVTFFGDNDVLSMLQMLYGSDSGSETLPQGRRVYPFSLILPRDIPSSFNGPYGSIFYKLKGIVDRPMRTDYEDEFIINVMSPIDFNTLPESLQNPVNYSDEKTVCCWCCKGGNLTMEVEIAKEAFIPGETIPLKVVITNLSNESCQSVTVKLTQTIKFTVETPRLESKQNTEELLSLKEHGVGAHGEHTFNFSLNVPEHVTLPNFNRCKLFHSNHSLDVTCEMGSCTSNLTIYINPTLGHIQRNSRFFSSGGGEALAYSPMSDVVGQPYPQSGLPMYPPQSGNIYLPANAPGGFIPPPTMPYAPPSMNEEVAPPYPVNASLIPTLSNQTNDNVFGNNYSKTMEASSYPQSLPKASAPSELPPPSYDDISKPPYPTN